jgi:hypothetical protein
MGRSGFQNPPFALRAWVRPPLDDDRRITRPDPTRTLTHKASPAALWFERSSFASAWRDRREKEEFGADSMVLSLTDPASLQRTISIGHVASDTD